MEMETELAKVNKDLLQTEGYRKLLDVLEVLQPGSKDKMIRHAEGNKGSVH